MPRDGQHYFEAVNQARSLQSLPWLRVPPVFGTWGGGPWGNFPWGGDRWTIEPAPSPDAFVFNVYWNGVGLVAETHFANPPYPLQVMLFYFFAQNTLFVPEPFDPRFRYGGAAAVESTAPYYIDSLVKKAGQWLPGRCVAVACDVCPYGGAPLVRFTASVRLA